MSIDAVLATLNAKAQDPATGLAAKVAAYATAHALAFGPSARIRTDFFFAEWLLSGKMRPTDAPQVAVRPRSWRPQQKTFTGTMRKADAVVEVSIEYVANDTTTLEDNAVIGAIALLQCVDEIESWVAAHGGPIKLIRDPIEVSFGTFDGVATRGGCLAVITLLEESAT